jgi:HPt (histidine-containing phosphotransfer) domain-containing protein
MPEAVIDLTVYRELQATAGAEFVDELVATFIEEAPRMLAELRAASAAQQADRFRRSAHSLKSNSLTFGATELAALARALELGGDAGPAALDALEAAWAQACDALLELSRHG